MHHRASVEARGARCLSSGDNLGGTDADNSGLDDALDDARHVTRDNVSAGDATRDGAGCRRG